MFNVHEEYSGVSSRPYYGVILRPKVVGDEPLTPAEKFIATINSQKNKAGGGAHFYIFWPECCVLCLGEVTGYRKVTGRGSWSEPYGGWGEEYQVTEMTLDVQVPYCSECKKKVRRIFCREEEAVHIRLDVHRPQNQPVQLRSVVVDFRNPEYAKRFVLDNSTIADNKHLRDPKKTKKKTMQLEINGEELIKKPTPELIRAAIGNLAEGEFASLSHDNQNYIQVRRDDYGTSHYQLEYRDGGPNRHFKADTNPPLTADTIAELFVRFSAKDPAWKDSCAWQRMKL